MAKKVSDRILEIEKNILPLLWTGMFVLGGTGFTLIFLTEYSPAKLFFGCLALILFIMLTFNFIAKLEYIYKIAQYLDEQEDKK